LVEVRGFPPFAKYTKDGAPGRINCEEVVFMDNDQKVGSDLVYHYTTAEGLKGIIENRCLWATNVNFLNDISEYRHGVDIVREEIKKYEVKTETMLAVKIEPTPSTRYLAKGIIAGNIEHQLKLINYSLWTFVTSFFDSPAPTVGESTNDAGDILEQWRAYGRDSVSFSIGFDKSALEKHVSGYDYGTAKLWTIDGRCSYEIERKKIKVKRIIESLEPMLPLFLQGDIKELLEESVLAISFDGSPSAKGEHFGELVEAVNKKFKETRNYEAITKKWNEVFPNFMGEIMVQPALMKDHSFLGEKEWRLVTFTTEPSKVLLRSSKSGLIPYLEVPLSDFKEQSHFQNDLIKRIVVGPLGLASQRERDNAIFAVRMLLQKNSIIVKDTRNSEGVIIESSSIPFRKW
jgi:hypothetical protein